jgi:hypothetical protein
LIGSRDYISEWMVLRNRGYLLCAGFIHRKNSNPPGRFHQRGENTVSIRGWRHPIGPLQEVIHEILDFMLQMGGQTTNLLFQYTHGIVSFLVIILWLFLIALIGVPVFIGWLAGTMQREFTCQPQHPA